MTHEQRYPLILDPRMTVEELQRLATDYHHIQLDARTGRWTGIISRPVEGPDLTEPLSMFHRPQA